jgi:hypothetical protein
VNPQGQSFSERRLADAWLADQQWIVLPPAAQHLDHALELERASDQRINLSSCRACNEVGRVRFKRIGRGWT